MQLTSILLLAACLQVSATAYGQKVTIVENNISLRKVFKEIRKQTGYNFIFSNKTIREATPVTLDLKDTDLQKVLNECFAGQPLSYTIDDNIIIVSPKPVSPVIRQLPGKEITGQVSDSATGQLLAGVTVKVEGSDVGAITDAAGKFSLEAPDGAVLVVSYLGYIPKTIPVNGRTTFNISLSATATGLNQLVVVGYGTQKKGNVTAAISTIQAKDIKTTTSSSLAQMLEGKIPGLQIRQQDGEPGSFNESINIRGFGQPLYVIDGIVRDGGGEFQQLNPNDIESISILKDASAAVYGLNAANGVILVTTKKGIVGKPTFSYNAAVGFQTPTHVPKMASAAQYLEMYDNAIFFRDGVHSISKEDLAKWQSGGPGYESTNWYDQTMKKSTMQQQQNFSVRGGSEKVNYYLSLGHYNENGLFKSNDMDYKRYNLRSNLSLKLSKNLNAQVLLSGIYSKRNYPGGDGFIWIYKGTIISHPNEKPYINDNPDYPANIYNQQNPVLMSQSKYAGYTQDQNKSFQSSASLTYDVPFLEGLQAKGTIAYDSRNMFNKIVWKDYKVYSPDLTSQVINPPRIANGVNDANRLVFQGQLDYKRTFNHVHDVSATVVFEQKRYNAKDDYLKREYDFFTTDVINDASGLQTNSGSETDEATMSYIGRFNYDYRGKYLAEYAFRYDGSYRYAPGRRWGFFPDVSVGWRISEENFIKNSLRFIDNLKLRASYGMIGEDVGDPFQYVLGFAPQTEQGAEFENGTYTGGLAAPGVVNRNFTWEKSTIQDIGLEADFFKGLLGFEVDLYQRLKTGKPKTRESGVPNTFGADMPVENLESEETKGFDLSITHRNAIHDFHYSVSANMNLARTMNKKVDKPAPRSSYDKWAHGYTDRWNDFLWGFEKTGQFQNQEQIIQSPIQDGDRGNSQILPGDYIYKDINGDGLIDDKDMLPIFRNRFPKLFYGFTMTAAWKNFDMSMVLQGAGLYTKRFNEVFSQMFFNNGNLPAYFYDRWHLADSYDPDSKWVPGKWPANRFVEDMGSSYRESSAWRKSSTYLRMKSLEIGYTIPLRITKKYFLNQFRIYANAHNLLTFANAFIKQFDPEKYEGDYLAGYNYPLTKSFNFGVNISF